MNAQEKHIRDREKFDALEPYAETIYDKDGDVIYNMAYLPPEVKNTVKIEGRKFDVFGGEKKATVSDNFMITGNPQLVEACMVTIRGLLHHKIEDDFFVQLQERLAYNTYLQPGEIYK